MYKVRDHNRLQSNEQPMARRQRGQGHHRVIDYSSHWQDIYRGHPAKCNCPAVIASNGRLGHSRLVALLLGIGLGPEPGRCRVVKSASAHAPTVSRMIVGETRFRRNASCYWVLLVPESLHSPAVIMMRHC